MTRDRAPIGARTPRAPGMDELRVKYGCGPVQFTGTGDALYERHLMFDNVVDPAAVGLRERDEAVARSVRDVLSQRWVRTEHTYERQNPKHIYYLAMEFLIGRSLANNVVNLRLDPIERQVAEDKGFDWLALLEEEPDAGLGNGGLGRLAASRGWYNPRWHYDNEPETRAALGLIFSNHLSGHDPGVFEPLRETLLTRGDHYMHLADLASYLEGDRRLLALYADPEGWAMNVPGRAEDNWRWRCSREMLSSPAFERLGELTSSSSRSSAPRRPPTSGASVARRLPIGRS